MNQKKKKERDLDTYNVVCKPTGFELSGGMQQVHEGWKSHLRHDVIRPMREEIKFKI